MPTIDLGKLVNWSYLFQSRPESNSELILALAILFAAAIVGSGIIWIMLVRRERTNPMLEPIRQKLVNALFYTGFIGLLLVFFRWQGIPYFASRFWLLLWLIISIVWIGRIVYYLLKKFPKERSLFEERLVRERYLPKAKK